MLPATQMAKTIFKHPSPIPRRFHKNFPNIFCQENRGWQHGIWEAAKKTKLGIIQESLTNEVQAGHSIPRLFKKDAPPKHSLFFAEGESILHLNSQTGPPRCIPLENR